MNITKAIATVKNEIKMRQIVFRNKPGLRTKKIKEMEEVLDILKTIDKALKANILNGADLKIERGPEQLKMSKRI